MARHRGCGGEIIEDEEPGTGYLYCSHHDGGCDSETCEYSMYINRLICMLCGQEILGDAMIVTADDEQMGHR